MVLFISIPVILLAAFLVACDDNIKKPATEEETTPDFYFGADFSFSNQIVDHSGVYQDMGAAESPYKIFADHGTNLVRLRLWHNLTWTNDGYGGDTGPLYSDLKDVAKSIGLAKEQGSEVLLDLPLYRHMGRPRQTGCTSSLDQYPRCRCIERLCL